MPSLNNAARRAVLIDFDDTLVYTNTVFDAAKEDFYAFMRGKNLYDSNLADKLNEIDKKNVIAAGYFAARCFPEALAETYRYYCALFGRSLCQADEDYCLSLGRAVYSAIPEQLPFAAELLCKLRKDYVLYLITQGDPAIQPTRIEKSGLRPFFERIYIPKMKKREVYSEIIAENMLDAAASWIIGNSLRFDIAPAAAAGLNAVYLRVDCWDFENTENTENTENLKNIKKDVADCEYHTAANLCECLAIINKQKVNFEVNP